LEQAVKSTLARLILGGIFVFASLDKIRFSVDFAQAVANYSLLPSGLVSLVAIVLPWIELVAGIFLVIGFLSEGSALVLGGLSITFALVLVSALARGLDIECGCFHGNEPISWVHPVLDAALLGLSLYILHKGAGPWAIDNRLFASSKKA
jgi:uncharacterized membrane protein YphA (DoxX/SURF4 family)